MSDVIGPTEVNADIEARAAVDNKPLSSRFWLGEIAAAKKRDAPWWKRYERAASILFGRKRNR